jgi:hypothetical protein
VDIPVVGTQVAGTLAAVVMAVVAATEGVADTIKA